MSWHRPNMIARRLRATPSPTIGTVSARHARHRQAVIAIIVGLVLLVPASAGSAAASGPAGQRWSPSSTEVLTQESGSGVAVRGHWYRRSDGRLLNGHALSSYRRGAKMSFRFTGSGVTVIGPTTPRSGNARIYIDGHFVKTVSARSSSYHGQVALYVAKWATEGTHTVTVVVLGSTPGTKFTVDAFAVNRHHKTSPPPPTPTPKPTPKPTPTPTPGTPGAWVTVVNDQFNSGGLPGHWSLYDGPYGSGPHNCAAPSHVTVSGGVLHLLMSYERAGAGSAGCGAGWYTGGLALSGVSTVDQQVTVRFRVVRSGAASHYIIPMRWPDSDASWPAGGEEDYCEADDTAGCDSYLHYGANNDQVSRHHAIDLSTWHVLRVERLNRVARVFVDDLANPVWTYTGSAATLPETLKHVVLQQECQVSCPSGTSGTEDIQIDWITVANPR